MSKKRTSVAVFCGASLGKDPLHEEKHFELGQALAHHNHHIYYGGGKTGLMNALMEGALDKNGVMTALIPSVYFDPTRQFHKNITVIPCETSETRLKSFMSCDFKILGSGGFGSMGELGVAMTQTVDSTYDTAKTRPLIFFNIKNHWDHIRSQSQSIIDGGFAKPNAQELFKFTNSTKTVLEIIKNGKIKIQKLSHS